MTSLAQRIELWPIEKIVPYSRNPRTHSDQQVAQIAASIVEFGFNNPVLVDSRAGVIAGHGRLLAARKLGLDHVPVIVLDHLDENQRRAYLLADNRLSELSGWDSELLAVEIKELADAGFDVTLAGFDSKEIDDFLASLENTSEATTVAAEDPIPEAPTEAITQPGDLWLIGPHRLICGDCRERSLLSRLFEGRKVTLVAYVRRTTAQAFNVTAKIVGRVPALGPVVLMAPRSAWWQSVSEQGSRLVCWLEAIRVLAAARPVRDCLFVALSGHELGFLGVEPYIERRPDLIKRAHAWIFFGSDIGSPRRQNRIHASDDAFEQWAVAVMEGEGLAVDAKAAHDATARGEAGAIQGAGGRFFTVVCPSDVFHSPADRWPDAVDVALLARYARAFANGALQLANQPRISG
jgi:hypothetical protein